MYIKTCETKRIPVNTIQVAMIEEQYNLPCPIETSPEVDMVRLDRYIQMTAQLAEFIGPEACVESVCLGMLYKMRHGITIQGIEMIPLDPWLLKVLPPINDLIKLGIDKKRINRGERLILGMYETTERKGQNLREVAIK
jgi:hypothetical protein